LPQHAFVYVFSYPGTVQLQPLQVWRSSYQVYGRVADYNISFLHHIKSQLFSVGIEKTAIRSAFFKDCLIFLTNGQQNKNILIHIDLITPYKGRFYEFSDFPFLSFSKNDSIKTADAN